MKPDEFIADWIENNPKGCQTLAGAELYSYFNDLDADANERILTLRTQISSSASLCGLCAFAL